jgi:hypothetical protein
MPLVNDTIDGTTITTATGSPFDLARPETWDGSVDSIAIGLGNTCRFGGQTRGFYSVAEHSVHVMDLVRQGGYPPVLQLAALLHDAHEAFYGDVVAPMKPLVPELVRLMERFDRVCEERFDLPAGILSHEQVKVADRIMLRVEAGILWTPRPPWSLPPNDTTRGKVVGLPPTNARIAFLEALDDVLGRVAA